MLGRAYLRAASVEVAVNGFRKCGIFPLNRHVFRDDDFAIHSQRERTPTPPQPHQEEIHVELSERDSEEDDVPLASINKRIQMSDTIITRPLVNSSISTPSTNKNLVKPADISPVPSCSYASTSKKGKRGATALITASPYKLELLDALDKKNKPKIVSKCLLNEQSQKRKVKQKPENCTIKGKGKQKKAKRPSTSSSEDVDTDTEVQLIDTDDDMDREEEDAECLYCNNFYSDDTRGEEWIRCTQCFRWAHEECAGTDKNTAFICENCLD